MKKGMKYTLGIAGAALAVLTLTACSNSAKSQQKVTLTYANWNLGTKAQNGIERQLIAAWNKANPDVQVKIDETISGSTNYTQALTTAASAGKLPDVFMSADVTGNYQSGWEADLTKIEGSDSEFKALPQAEQTSTEIKGKNVAIPFGNNQVGWYVNNDLLNKLNLAIPTAKTSVPDWLTEVKKATDLSQKTIGVSEAPSFADWMSGELNPNLGMFTFANGKFNLTDAAMTQTMANAADIGKNGYSFAQLTPDQQKALSGGTDPYAAFLKGEVAFLYSGTSNATDIQKKANFNFSYMGLPGGRQNIVLDYTVVSKSSKNVQDAYNFSKYMSFGEEGYKERLKLTKASGTTPAYLPLTTNSSLVDQFWGEVTVPGMKESTSDTSNPMMDPIKTVPGYINARWNAQTGLTVAGKANATVGDIVNDAGLGTVNWSDYASQLQTLAQKQYDTAYAALK